MRSAELSRDASSIIPTPSVSRSLFNMDNRCSMHACAVTTLLSTSLRRARTKRLPGHGVICVFVKHVDSVHAELAERGANVIKPPQNYDYGMRDFDVIDLDGNHLTFGII